MLVLTLLLCMHKKWVLLATGCSDTYTSTLTHFHAHHIVLFQLLLCTVNQLKWQRPGLLPKLQRHLPKLYDKLVHAMPPDVRCHL